MQERTPNGGATIVALALTLALASPAAASASCDPTGTDAVALAAARQAVAAACDCDAAPSARAWRTCVRGALAPSVGGTLSKACARFVERYETESTCGRPDRVACCRTSVANLTRAFLRRGGHCDAPPGGSACESVWPRLGDACVAGGCAPSPPCGNFVVEPGEDCDPPDGLYCSSTCTACTTELGCVTPSSCGNGVLDAGEACDPPNGTTCSSTCSACAPAAPGEILIGCTAALGGAFASALPGTLLVAYGDRTPGSATHAVARRLANDGTFVDTTPLLVSGPLPGSGALGGAAEATTASSDEFYVAWGTARDFVSLWGARRVPATGPLTDPPAQIQSSFGFGSCRSTITGPAHLAPALDDLAFLSTWRFVYSCSGGLLGETLLGVGDFFHFPPPGDLSSGPAPIIRGASDVAAVWWNGTVVTLTPPYVIMTLSASFVAPGTPTKLELASGFSTVAPALAVLGDTFFAFHASGNALRVIRFSRAGGVLDPSGGIAVATTANPITQLVAAGDGTSAIVAWLESDGTVRATRVAADGTLPDPAPTTVTTTDAAASIAVAANATTALVTFTRSEGASRSVRGVLLPAGF